MSTISMTDLDVRVRDHVMGQLDWDPEVDASQIGVAAKNGVVTLTGYIDTYAGKLAAERAVKRVRGVKGVANDLQVRLKIGRTDADIARDAVRALELRGTVPETIQVAVHDGHITLTGRPAGSIRHGMPKKRSVISKASGGSSITSRSLRGGGTGRPAPHRPGTPPECGSRRAARGHRRLRRRRPAYRFGDDLAAARDGRTRRHERSWNYWREKRDSRRTSRAG